MWHGLRLAASALAVAAVASPLAAQAMPAAFPVRSYSLPPQPSDVALGDLDGDGRLDAVVACQGLAALSVRLGKGAGSFGPRTEYPTLLPPARVVLGDLDEDGALDAVAAVTGARLVRLVGDGHGGLAHPEIVVTGTGLGDLALADLDGDGHLDAAVVGSAAGAGIVNVHAGTGTGSFGSTTTWPTPFSAMDAVPADLNGDGRLDLAVPMFGASGVAVLLAAPAGGFLPASLYTAGGVATALAAGDLDGDGDADLAAARFDKTTANLLWNDGSGLFPIGSATSLASNLSPTTSFSSVAGIAIADVTGDLRPDLVVPFKGSPLQQMSVVPGSESGGFDPSILLMVGGDPLAFSMGDLTQDGLPDVALVVSTGFLRVLVSAPGGPVAYASVDSFSVYIGGPTTMSVGDMNLDGSLDAITGLLTHHSWQSSRSRHYGKGDGTLGFQVQTQHSGDPTFFVLYDVTGDGAQDLVAMIDLPTNHLHVYAGTGVQPGSLISASSGAGNGPFFALGDLDGDDRPDVVTANGGLTGLAGNSLGIYRNDGTGAMVAYGVSLTGASGAPSVALGDIDLDGNLDAVAGEPAASTISIHLGDGAGMLGAPAFLSTAQPFGSIALHDLDLDGWLDIVAATWWNAAESGLMIRLGDGAGSFGPPVTRPTETAVGRIVAGDVDGDGLPDVVASGPSGQYVSFHGLPGGALSTGEGYATDVGSELGCTLADMDADGRLDWVTASSGYWTIEVHRATTPLPVGVAAFGTGTPGCAARHGLNAAQSATLGTPRLRLTATQTPPSAEGVLLLVDASDAAGSDPFGVGVVFHVDLLAATQVAAIDMHSDATGFGRAEVPVPDDPSLVGETFFFQSLWLWTHCPKLPIGVSSSRALAVTVQR